MIYDGMAGVERYGGLYRGFDVLIDWLGKNDYRALEAGTRSWVTGSSRWRRTPPRAGVGTRITRRTVATWTSRWTSRVTRRFS